MPYETEKGQAQIAALWKEDPLVTPSGDWRAGLCEKALGSSALAAEMASSLLGCIRSRATRSRIGAEPLDQGFTAAHSKRQETAGVSWNTAGSTQAHR